MPPPYPTPTWLSLFKLLIEEDNKQEKAKTIKEIKPKSGFAMARIV
jgi:hypothetical protein